MVPIRAFLMLFVFSSVALSGCLGDGDIETENEDFDPLTTGTIFGEVWNEQTFEAVPGARVALFDGETRVVTTNTSADGNYTLQGIKPGDYRLQVFSPCCRQAVEPVVVEAATTIEKNFLLDPLGDVAPREAWIDYDSWSGSIGCMVTIVDSGESWIPGPYFNCGQFDPNHDTETSRDVFPGVKSVTVGLEWNTAPITGADELELRVLNSVGSYSYASEVGSSPIVVQITDDDIEDEKQKFSWYTDEGVTWALNIHVRPSNIGLVYQQAFQVYYAIHYWEEASPDYTPILD